MAKSKSLGDTRKITFGKRKKGAAQKSFNKHTPRNKKYVAQGLPVPSSPQAAAPEKPTSAKQRAEEQLKAELSKLNQE
jgi:hypothetical protein